MGSARTPNPPTGDVIRLASTDGPGSRLLIGIKIGGAKQTHSKLHDSNDLYLIMNASTPPKVVGNDNVFT